jgi:glycosyltransferase involved in cell wall biosynthesis
MKIKNVWAVIPAYNEEKNVGPTIKKSRDYVDNVVLIDDGSHDKTHALGKKAGATVLKHIINLGKGATLKTGCDYAFKNGARYVVTLDADSQHDPKDIPRFIEKLDKYDIVFSYRKLSKKMPFVLRFGNKIISEVSKLLYNLDLKDTQSGFRAFSKEAYKKIRWKSLDYSMESEMISKAGKQKLKYVQIPIETIYSDRYKGTTIIDGIKIVINMFKWKLFDRNKKGETWY